MYAIAYGDPFNGMAFAGPIDDVDEAIRIAESYYEQWWIVELEQP